MINVYKRNMLGVLLSISLMAATIALPVNGEEGVMAASNVISVTTVNDMPVVSTVTIVKEDLVALKAALDGLQGVILALDAYVAKLPKDSNERMLIAQKMNEVLGAMSVNLIALNGTLAASTVVPSRNLVEVKPASVDAKETAAAVNSLSNLKGANSALVDSKDTTGDEIVASEKKTEEASTDQGLLSSLKTSLNSPPGVIVLIVFAMIFGVVVFMRVSSGKEAQTT